MKSNDGASQTNGAAPSPPNGASQARGSGQRSAVAKVSHTLSVELAERLEAFAFFQRVSESAVIEHCLSEFFHGGSADDDLGERLRRGGAGRRRKS